MIPKVIHYCWFGRKEMPRSAKKCINSWKKFLPDYEIKEWNEDNFDISLIPYTQQAYEAGKYAFVSDYARFYILYHHGGIYFDTDVEVIGDMENILGKGPFMGREMWVEEGTREPEKQFVAAGLGIAAEPRNCIYAEILEQYQQVSFRMDDGSYNMDTVVTYIGRVLVKHGLKGTNKICQVGNILIYPKDYFCPKDYQKGKIRITPNTVSIHHYGSTWMSRSDRMKLSLQHIIGEKTYNRILNLKSKLG